MANSEIIGAGQDTALRAPKINTITCGDCMPIMLSMPDKSVDLCLTDLPYGVLKDSWDSVVSDEYLNQIFRISKKQVIWGYNFYKFPPTRSYICWNKRQWIKTKSSAELAWCSHGSPCVLDFTYAGNCSGWAGEKIKVDYKKKSVHPAQKPDVIFWYCVNEFSRPEDIVFDPFIGSGTTAIACINTGRNYIGIEKEEKYCRIAEERIHALRSPAQNTMEICHTAPNSASPKAAQEVLELGL
jgi:DNA modification methylase